MDTIDVPKPKIAVLSFPGNNCEVESLRALRRNGIEPVFFRWNDDTEKLADVDGYFVPGGFSYEDRGRSGMIAGRDALMRFVSDEAAMGKVVIGNCNGAQILVESGLIPLGNALDMCLARNLVDSRPVGFLSEWIWITPTCKRDRCAASDWEGPMHLPIAHGEGRFTTRDPDLYAELRKNDQIAFSYCDANGSVSEQPLCTPNGSAYAIAGICNPNGNVIALMPHPERTELGDRYFRSIKGWIENTASRTTRVYAGGTDTRSAVQLAACAPALQEVFIDTIIVNNEERTVEQAARSLLSSLRLKQLKYIPVSNPAEYLSHLANFNPNKEAAYIRRQGRLYRWNPRTKTEDLSESSVLSGIKLLRRDQPYEADGDPGICFVMNGVTTQELTSQHVLEFFGNPHASTLSVLQ